ncbi:MAG: flavodoxin domain-containing protein [Chloroflexi bacterium]|nr:flavodoxin domain-containing protein [Chloroflexota bacterium]
MKKVLIAYFSLAGMTAKMAEYIAEGVRLSGHEAVVKKIGDIKDTAEMTEYDGCIFGAPTFSLDLPKPMKTFLSTAAKVNLEGKLGGAFGAYTHDVAYRHDTHAPAIIFDILQKEHKMEPFALGPFNLPETKVETSEGMHACHDYGKAFGETVSS